mmetsp:Transcript_14770/g.51440  ORF Transcript_14770/g.51440 Transcript_14770/m.51440 type:complete len:213 (+) Transcript_14770:870-1508(+)
MVVGGPGGSRSAPLPPPSDDARQHDEASECPGSNRPQPLPPSTVGTAHAIGRAHTAAATVHARSLGHGAVAGRRGKVSHRHSQQRRGDVRKRLREPDGAEASNGVPTRCSLEPIVTAGCWSRLPQALVVPRCYVDNPRWTPLCHLVQCGGDKPKRRRAKARQPVVHQREHASQRRRGRRRPVHRLQVSVQRNDERMSIDRNVGVATAVPRKR